MQLAFTIMVILGPLDNGSVRIAAALALLAFAVGALEQAEVLVHRGDVVEVVAVAALDAEDLGHDRCLLDPDGLEVGLDVGQCSPVALK